jgi:hypothetical protein
MAFRPLTSTGIGVFGLDEGKQNCIYVSHRVSEGGGKSMAAKVFIYGKVG